MTFVITEPCIGRKERSCVDVCPVDCIYDTETMLVIDPVECIDCGACEPECPVEAIFRDVDVPDDWKSFTAINEGWREGPGRVEELLKEHGHA